MKNEAYCNHDEAAVWNGVCECGEIIDPWGSDPDYTPRDWRQEVASDGTRLGYWDWVKGQREFDAEERLSR